MYNPERKKSFIEAYESDRIVGSNYFQNLFSRTEPLEKEFGKDVCDFTKEEIIALFISFNSSYGSTNISIRSRLAKYTEFCCYNNLSRDNINHYYEITGEEVAGYANQFMKNKYYISKKKLDGYCSKLANACDCFVLYALFEGIKGKYCEEITDMTLADIDIKNRIVTTVNNKKIKVSQEFIKFAVKSDQELEYASPMRPYTFHSSSLPYIFKNRVNITDDSEDRKRRRVLNKVNYIKNMLSAPEITVPHLVNSGFVHYFLQLMEEKECDDYLELINSNDPDYLALLQRYNMNQTNVTSNILRNYLRES